MLEKKTTRNPGIFKRNSGRMASIYIVFRYDHRYYIPRLREPDIKIDTPNVEVAAMFSLVDR
jgi:hypothetical protein